MVLGDVLFSEQRYVVVWSPSASSSSFVCVAGQVGVGSFNLQKDGSDLHF